MSARVCAALAYGALMLAGAVLAGISLVAQTPPRPSETTQAGTLRPRPQTATFPPSTHATVNQLMRGLFFPASNVVFAAQGDDPAAVPRDRQGSKSTDLLKSVFGGWEAVENSALAIADAAPLLLAPGRTCANGRPAPVTEAEWTRATEDTRQAALASFRAARARDQDLVLDAAGQLAEACSRCHRVYRSEGSTRSDPQARCAPRPAVPSGRPR